MVRERRLKSREKVGRRETKRESGFEPRDILGKIFYPFKVRPSTWPLLDHSSSACVELEHVSRIGR